MGRRLGRHRPSYRDHRLRAWTRIIPSWPARWSRKPATIPRASRRARTVARPIRAPAPACRAPSRRTIAGMEPTSPGLRQEMARASTASLAVPSIMAIQVFHQVDCDGTPCASSSFMDILFGLERVYELRGTYAFAAVNMSLGTRGQVATTPCNGFRPAIDAIVANLKSVGIATIVAAGNDGSYPFGLQFPACISTAISVGSTKDGSGSGGYTDRRCVALLEQRLLPLSPRPGPVDHVLGSRTAVSPPSKARRWPRRTWPAPGRSRNRHIRRRRSDDILAGVLNTGSSSLIPETGSTVPRIAFTVLQFSASAYNVAETAGTATITVTRSGSMFGPHLRAADVDYATSANGAVSRPGLHRRPLGPSEFNDGRGLQDVHRPDPQRLDGRRPSDGEPDPPNPGAAPFSASRDTADLTIGDDDVGGVDPVQRERLSAWARTRSAAPRRSRSPGPAAARRRHRPVRDERRHGHDRDRLPVLRQARSPSIRAVRARRPRRSPCRSSTTASRTGTAPSTSPSIPPRGGATLGSTEDGRPDHRGRRDRLPVQPGELQRERVGRERHDHRDANRTDRTPVAST